MKTEGGGVRGACDGAGLDGGGAACGAGQGGGSGDRKTKKRRVVVHGACGGGHGTPHGGGGYMNLVSITFPSLYNNDQLQPFQPASPNYKLSKDLCGLL